MKTIDAEIYRAIAKKTLSYAEGATHAYVHCEGLGWDFDAITTCDYSPESGHVVDVMIFAWSFICCDEDGNEVETDFQINELKQYL